MQGYLAAVSCGVVEGNALLDLCYKEDSNAEADMNFVGTEDGGISELQISGEKRTVSGDEFVKLVALCKKGVEDHIAYQREILEAAE